MVRRQREKIQNGPTREKRFEEKSRVGAQD